MFTRLISQFSFRFFLYCWGTLSDASWREEGVENVFWSLYRNAQDGAFVCDGGEKMPLRAGVCYLVPPRCRYDYGCAGRIEQLWVCFDVLGISPQAVRHLFPSPFPLTLSPASSEAMDAVAAAPQATVGLLAHCRCLAALTEGLTHALGTLPPERLEGTLHLTDDETPVRLALQHIAENLAERLPNRELAAQCHMSEDYFIRRFHESVGRTPGQYVLEARVKAATEYLLFSDLSLEQIAARVGFGSRQYLSRAFGHQMGVGPATYRRTRRDGKHP